MPGSALATWDDALTDMATMDLNSWLDFLSNYNILPVGMGSTVLIRRPPSLTSLHALTLPQRQLQVYASLLLAWVGQQAVLQALGWVG